MFKDQPLWRRFGFAAAGIGFAARRERSFRSQLALGALLLVALVVLRPPAVWCALCLLSAGMVLAAEMVNTALEQALDRLHPERHDAIRIAKDCAAGAVLVASLTALAIGGMTVLVALGRL